MRAYIAELLAGILEGSIEHGRVFDRVVGLDGVPDGYWAMGGRDAITVPLDDVRAAFEQLEQGHSLAKIVLLP